LFDTLVLPSYSAPQGSHAVFPSRSLKIRRKVPDFFGIAVNSLSIVRASVLFGAAI